jgi:fumarate hydratase subunit beta
VLEIGWTEMVVHYRVLRLRVEGLGPATIGIDAHGRSLYAEEQQSVEERLPELMAELDAARARSGVG